MSINFLGNGESGFQQMVLYSNLYSFQLLTMVLGVGSTKANEGVGDEDEEVEELTSASWVGLLDEEDGVCSLELWGADAGVKWNKANTGCALRQLMRQAWSECCLTVGIYFSI